MWSARAQLGIRCLAIVSIALATGGVFSELSLKRGKARENADLHGRIVDARRMIATVDRLDVRRYAPANGGIPLNINLPPGSAQVWLPELVKTHFTNAGMNVSSIRLTSLHAIPEVRDFQRGYWSVGVSVNENEKNISSLLTAVSQFERQNKFVRVLDFSIAEDPENPGTRMAGMNITALVAN